MDNIDVIGNSDGAGSTVCGASDDQIALPLTDSLMQENGLVSVQHGFQGLDLQDLVGTCHAKPTMHFSSNHLLVAAKWFHQKRLQRALASSGAQTLPAAQPYADDHTWLSSHAPLDGVKLSSQSMWEGGAGTINESPSATSNGSKTSSPKQMSSDSLASSIGNAPYFSCFPCAREQTESHGLFYQARREFHDGMLDCGNGTLVQVNQSPDALWGSHAQVSHGVLVPSFPSQNAFNKSRNSCEGAMGKSKPRVRARRGQATDPHSIAERLRRERIADRIKSLQELVPNTNKTDRAIMLDEIIEYVKFLLVQVKLLSMSRLSSAALILPIVPSVLEGDSMHLPADGQVGSMCPSQDSMSVIEEHVARLINSNVGAALQFLQRKGLCLVPISLTESSKSSADANLSAAQSQQPCPLSLASSSAITTVTK